jgi:hypothetical protein
MFLILSVIRLNTQKGLLVIDARGEISYRMFFRGKGEKEGEAGR